MATVRIQLRRGASSDWDTNNPILADGEIGIETDTRRIKFGNGQDNWNDLQYGIVNNDGTPLTTDDYGQPDGVPQLDGSGYIKSENLPPLAKITVHSVANQAARLALTVEPGDIAIQSDTGTSYVLQSSPASTNANWKELTATQAIQDAVDAAVSAMLDGAPGALNTLNELAAAIGDDPAFFTTIATNLSNHEADTTNIHGIADTAALATKTYADNAVSAHEADTTSVHGIADTAALATKTYADNAATNAQASAESTAASALSSHEADTTGIHGIADTAALATKTYADNAATNAQASAESTAASALSSHEADTTGIHGIADTAALATKTYADNAVSTHEADTTSVHGIADTAALATKTYADNSAATAQSAAQSYTDNQIGAVLGAAPAALNTLQELGAALGNDADFSGTVTASLATKAPLADPTFTGSVTLPSTTSIGDVSATEIGYVNGVTSGIQTQLDAKLASATAESIYAPKADPVFTGTVTLPSTTLIGDVSATEIGYVNGVTSGIQTQLDAKLASATAASTYAPIDAPVFTGIVTLPSTTSIGDVSATEIGYVNGVTSGIQTQLNEKLASDIAASTYAPIESPTFTGTVTLPSTTLIGDVSTTEIGYVNGVTSNIQSQLDTKLASSTAATTYAPLASPTFTGTVTLPNGTVTNSMIADLTIATGKIADTAITAGKLGADAVTTEKIINSAVTEAKIADSAVTSGKIANGTIVNADINAAAAIDWTKLAISSTVSATELGYVDGVTSAIQTQIDAKLASATAASTYAPLASPTFTGTVSGISKSMVGLGNVDNTSDANKPVSTATQTALDNKLSLAGGTMTGALTLSGAPSSDLHAATKAYVDNVSSGINFHQPVRVATTGNITLSGTQTIDGVAVIAGDRVLVKDQTTQTQNGIYVVAAGSWTRAADADNTPSGELAGGDFTLVLEGTVNSGYGYVCSNTSAITIGTTNVTYAAFNAAKAVSAGTGLTESTPGTLAVDSSTVQFRVSGVSDTEIGYLDGVTSAIQTQLDAKAPTASPTFTGTVTVAASGVAFTDGTQTKEGVPSRTTVDSKTADYTLVLTDRDKMIEVNSSSALTVSIPTDASVNFPIGTSIDLLRVGSGSVTISAVTPATTTLNYTPGNKLRAQWSSATLFKRAANTWVLMGDLTA